MATVTTVPAVHRRAFLSRTWSHPADSPVVSVALGTALAFVLLGYHPCAEDGGIYAAALAARLDPTLFPAGHEFAIAHTGRTLFIPVLALLARVLHLSPAAMLLATYVASLAATVGASRSLAKVLFSTLESQRWAVATLLVSLGVPIAGTSLYLFDPYLTARSLSTPLVLWALSLLLRRRFAASAGCLLIAFALHPMMAATSALVFGFAAAMRSSRRAVWAGCLASVVLLAMALLRFIPVADGAAVRAASVSRSYWFPTDWAWYEVVGLIAPMVLLPAISLWARRPERLTMAARQLALAAALAVAVVSCGMLLFVHPANASMLLARLQPLRLLHTVYFVFVLLLGGLAGRVRLHRRLGFGWAVCAVAGVSLLCMQRSLYSNSPHVELPWRGSTNGYQQAFVWARDHTPQNALFALDASYTTADGEDADLFRAIALRSSLPDAAKDGGIASVMPQLASEWQAAARAQAGLASASDGERITRVVPLGATWIVLPSSATTLFDCRYANNTAKVCRLP